MAALDGHLARFITEASLSFRQSTRPSGLETARRGLKPIEQVAKAWQNDLELLSRAVAHVGPRHSISRFAGERLGRSNSNSGTAAPGRVRTSFLILPRSASPHEEARAWPRRFATLINFPLLFRFLAKWGNPAEALGPPSRALARGPGAACETSIADQRSWTRPADYHARHNATIKP